MMSSSMTLFPMVLISVILSLMHDVDFDDINSNDGTVKDAILHYVDCAQAKFGQVDFDDVRVCDGNVYEVNVFHVNARAVDVKGVAFNNIDILAAFMLACQS